MKKLLLLLSFLLVSVLGYAQITFERHYGNSGVDGASGVLQTNDGGYIVLGNGFANIIRTDQHGDTLWTKRIGYNLDQRFLSIKNTNDNGYILCGSTHGLGFYSINYLLLKVNANGDTLWQKGYGGNGDDDAYDVIQTSDSGFALVGASTSFGDAIYFVKTDNQGDTLWTKLYSKSFTSFAYSLIQLPDNGYIIVGETGIGSVNRNLLVIRTNINGDTVWMKTFGGIDYESGSAVKETDDGGFIISGITRSYGSGHSDVYLLKINENGVLQWSKTYGGPAYEEGFKLVICSDGGFAIAGMTGDYYNNNNDSYLIRTNSIGDTLWTKTFINIGNDGFTSLQETSDGGFILAGFITIGGNSDIYLVKTDANGHVAGINDYTSSMNKEINAFPNPTTRKVNIQIPQQFGQTKTLEVFDFVGQKQFEKTNDFTEIDISSLVSGLYFLVLTNKDNERQIIKIIKE